MNITVYCGSNEGNDPEFISFAKDLGRWMAAGGHRLVYGGGNSGMMGALSYAFTAAGGRATGVSPAFFMENEEVRTDLEEMIVADDMAVRRITMMELGDAFIALPGGMGTLDEISEAMVMKRLGLCGMESKPVMLCNINGYYDSLFEFIDEMTDQDFCRVSDRDNTIEVRGIADIEEALDL